MKSNNVHFQSEHIDDPHRKKAENESKIDDGLAYARAVEQGNIEGVHPQDEHTEEEGRVAEGEGGEVEGGGKAPESGGGENQQGQEVPYQAEQGDSW